MSCLISSIFLYEQVRIGDTPKAISDKEFDDLAEATHGFSGSDISYFVSVSFTLDISMSPK